MLFEMFGLWKKRPAAQAQEKFDQELQSQVVECTGKIKDKWMQYNSMLAFKSNVSLAEIIESFSIPVGQFVQNSYPVLLKGPNSGRLFWMMVLAAVMQSGTHEKQAVNDAALALEKKFAG